MNNIDIIFLCLITPFFVLYFLDRIFKFKWTCKVFSWHDGDGKKQEFDGCSMCSVCSKCGKKVIMDSQGNWF